VSKICQITKKAVMSGNNVSHAKNRTRRIFEPNLHNHRLWSEVQNKWITLKLSTKGLRIIDKFGLDKALEKYNIT
jgi:large subunit ribosomal protein L28